MANIKYTVVEPADEVETDSRNAEVDGHAVERRDPHGHWWFKDDKNSRALGGSYTHLDEVKKAVHRYNVEVAAKRTEKTEK